jgi:hypothetical protein
LTTRDKISRLAARKSTLCFSCRSQATIAFAASPRARGAFEFQADDLLALEAIEDVPEHISDQVVELDE